MKNLIGKRFELSEVTEAGGGLIASLTFVGEDEVIRLEGDAVHDHHCEPLIAVSIESLTEPHPGDELLTDVFAGTFQV